MRASRDDRKSRSRERTKGSPDRSQTSSTANYKLNRIKSTATTIAALAKTPPLFTIPRTRKIFYGDARNCNVARRVINNASRSLVPRRGGLTPLARFSLALARVGFIGMLNCCPRRKSASKHGSANLSSCFFRRVGVAWSIFLSSAPAEISPLQLVTRNIPADYYSSRRKEKATEIDYLHYYLKWITIFFYHDFNYRYFFCHS